MAQHSSSLCQSRLIDSPATLIVISDQSALNVGCRVAWTHSLQNHSADMKTRGGIVALVEDDHSLNHAMARLLSANGFDVRTFDSGEALLADAAIVELDCLVIDIQLPGMSGLQLSQSLSHRGIRTPFIIVTAHDEPEHRHEAMGLGAASYLTKPFSRVTFIDAVITAMALPPTAKPS